MPTTVSLAVEVCGCPTSCLHCWASGGPYPPVLLDDIAVALKGGRDYCEGAGLVFAPFPLHEMLAHPHILAMLDLFKSATLGTDFCLEPIVTTGVPIAVRPDWKELLDGLVARGSHTLWLALHGMGEVHDGVVHRTGAFQETLLAIDRAHGAGMACGANLLLTRQNVHQFDQWSHLGATLGIQRLWDVATYYPTARLRSYEPLRPELADLLPIAEQIIETLAFGRDRWAELEKKTEAAYMREALQTDDDQQSLWNSPPPEERISLTCRPDLSVLSGVAYSYGPSFGNLRRDAAKDVFSRAVSSQVAAADQRYIAGQRIPSVRELARTVGDPNGQKVHLSRQSMRNRWLDLYTSQMASSARP